MNSKSLRILSIHFFISEKKKYRELSLTKFLIRFSIGLSEVIRIKFYWKYYLEPIRTKEIREILMGDK